MNDYPNTRKEEGKREWDCALQRQTSIYNAESRDSGTVHVTTRPMSGGAVTWNNWESGEPTDRGA